jgi:hypothetical protein
MGIELLLGSRNALVFSLMLSICLAFPVGSLNILYTLKKKRRIYKAEKLAKKNNRVDKKQGSFWEIDMTKFEP